MTSPNTGPASSRPEHIAEYVHEKLAGVNSPSQRIGSDGGATRLYYRTMMSICATVIAILLTVGGWYMKNLSDKVDSVNTQVAKMSGQVDILLHKVLP